MTEPVQSVLRSFDVLRVLAAHGDAVPLAVIADDAALPKSTASRLLTTLESIAMVARGPSPGTYVSGPALPALVGAPRMTAQLVGVAHPYLVELADRFGEDAALAIPDGTALIYADQVRGHHPIQVPNWTRQRFAPHTVAAGFVMMAWWPAARLDAYLRGPLPPATTGTMTDAAAIRARVAEVRRRGYVWTAGEWVDGIGAVAAAVTTAGGELLAVLNVFGPSFRFPGARDPDEISAAVSDGARRLGRVLA